MTGVDDRKKCCVSENDHKRKSLSCFAPPAQKKKRRKSRWSAGFYAKKKSSSSPHTSRDDAHLGSDEEEEDGDDEDEFEKRLGTECDDGTERKEEQMVIDVEPGPSPTQEGSIGQDSQEGREDISQAAEHAVVLCEIGKAENDYQAQNNNKKVDMSITDQEQSDENKVLTKAVSENSETISVNTNQYSHTEMERDTLGQSNSGKIGKTNIWRLRETENNKVVTVDEAEQNSFTGPMEVEAKETVTTDASEAVRGEDTGEQNTKTAHESLAKKSQCTVCRHIKVQL